MSAGYIKKTNNPNIGRPKVQVPWDEVNNMCEIQCTGNEIAFCIGISLDALNAACKREHGIRFTDYIKIQSQGGKRSLRRKLWEMAMNNNTTIALWLSKQYLGMSDNPLQEIDDIKYPEIE
jgi:hypothetical protein